MAGKDILLPLLKQNEKVMEKFNINECVYVEITEKGFLHLQKTVGNDYIDDCIMPNKYIITGTVYYKLQCHEVFRLFPLTLGGDLMFGTNILIPDTSIVEIGSFIYKPVLLNEKTYDTN